MIALLTAMLLVTGGCGMLDLPRPTAKVVGAGLRDVSLTDAQLLFDVEVSNPYSVPLPLTNTDYALASRGVGFLSGEAPLSGSIPAGESKVLALPVDIDFIQLVQALEGVMPGSIVPYDADLGLSVDAPLLGRLRLPMTKQGQIAVPSFSDIPWP